MFSGLSAFPLTPMNEHRLDEAAFVRLIGPLVAANADSISVLGSTGNYAYLTKAERARAVRLAVVGVSGDAFAANGLNAGCEAWYSVV